MKNPVTPLILGLVSLITTAPVIQATSPVSCYQTGESYTPWKAKYHSYRACHGYDENGGRVAGAFQGEFKPGETKSACVDTVGNVKYQMYITLNNDQSTDMDDDLCSNAFAAIVDECSDMWNLGGYWIRDGWTVLLDPNAGTC